MTDIDRGTRRNTFIVGWALLALGVSAIGLLILTRCGLFREKASLWLDLVGEHQFAEAYYAPRYELEGANPDDLVYLDNRWHRTAPNKPGFLSIGPTAAFEIPLATMPVSGILHLAPRWGDQAGPREVALRVNGAQVLRFPAPTRTRREFTIPPRLVRTGLNELEIECPGASSFRVIKLRLDSHPGSTTWQDSERGSWVDSAGGRPGIFQIPGAQLSFYLRPSPQAVLRFRLPAVTNASAVHTVTVQQIGGVPETVFTGHSGDGPVEVPLGASSRGPLRLTFDVKRLEGDGERADPVAFPWGAPRIVVPPSASAARRPSTRPALPRRPNIILYVIDALRADHLQTYGYQRATSPVIAEFAQDAMVFDHAYAHSVWTRPSVGSLMTGLLPNQHLAVNDTGHLSSSLRLMSSYLHQAGYTCIGLQTNGNAGRNFGFDRDFDVFLPRARAASSTSTPSAARRPPQETAAAQSDEERRERSRAQSRSSERVLFHLVRLADELKEPYFLFIQTIDPHDPYDPPEGFRQLAAGRTIPGPHPEEALRQFLSLPDSQVRSAEAERLRRHLEALYDCEIRHNDHYFGQVLEFLRQRMQYDAAAIILTADHGEAFREHGYDGYHSTFYENTIRVPLILRLPFSKSGSRVQTIVQHIDLLPTLLDLAGLDPPDLPGRSLLAAAETGDEVPPPTVHAIRYRDLQIPRFPTEGRAVVSWPWKLIQNDIWRPSLEVYDVERDPGEQRNLWPRTDPVLMGFFMEEARRVPLRLREVYAGETKLTPEMEEALRALGYME